MQVEAVIAAVAESKRGVEPAFWDLAHVILVEVVALIALLAQATKPMLADGSLVGVP